MPKRKKTYRVQVIVKSTSSLDAAAMVESALRSRKSFLHVSKVGRGRSR